jgi:ketosteroid isomerase-like protein
MATSATGADDAVRQIREMDAAFVRNANAGNVPALVDGFYAEDAHLMPPNSPRISGKAAIAEFWKAVIAAGASGVQLDTTEISTSGELAYGVGNYSYLMSGSPQAGKYVVVYRLQPNGMYRAVVDMFSPNA